MSGSLTDQEFRVRADDALEGVQHALVGLADAEGFDVDLQNGVLDIRFDDPAEARFIISPNAPVRQVWVSALGRGYRLPWSSDLQAFALDGEPLEAVVTRLVHTHLGR